MAQRKKTKSGPAVKPSHRHVRTGFSRLRAKRFAEAVQSFQRALALAQGTDELDGEDFARIDHLTGQCLRELRDISAPARTWNVRWPRRKLSTGQIIER